MEDTLQLIENDSIYYSRGSSEETKAWLRKAVRRKKSSTGKIEQHKNIINKLGHKLNAFINNT